MRRCISPTGGPACQRLENETEVGIGRGSTWGQIGWRSPLHPRLQPVHGAGWTGSSGRRRKQVEARVRLVCRVRNMEAVAPVLLGYGVWRNRVLWPNSRRIGEQVRMTAASRRSASRLSAAAALERNNKGRICGPCCRDWRRIISSPSAAAGSATAAPVRRTARSASGAGRLPLRPGSASFRPPPSSRRCRSGCRCGRRGSARR